MKMTRSIGVLALIGTFCVVGPGCAQREIGRCATVNAADFYSPDSPTCGLQEAIDSLPEEGGIVVVPPRTFLLKRSIALRSNVTLRGSGASSILEKCAQVRSPLTRVAKEGDKVAHVESVDGFEVGAEVCVMEQNMDGWLPTLAIITKIEENTLHLSKAINKTCDPAQGGVVINFFPAINAWHQNHMALEDLCIDGNLAANSGPEELWTFSAIDLVDCRDVRIEDCVIRSWVSDGICMGGCRKVYISGCTVEDCRGNGIHAGAWGPAGGTRHCVFSGNVVQGAGRDGFFFCWEVHRCVISNNIFRDNKGHGIGHLGGGGGGDKWNIVANNVCQGNGLHGIWAHDGDNNSIVGNMCLDNSQREPGRWSGIALSDTRDTLVSGNRCLDDQHRQPGNIKKQKYGIVETGTSDYNLISGNHCRGNVDTGVKTIGKHTQKANNTE